MDQDHLITVFKRTIIAICAASTVALLYLAFGLGEDSPVRRAISHWTGMVGGIVLVAAAVIGTGVLVGSRMARLFSPEEGKPTRGTFAPGPIDVHATPPSRTPVESDAPRSSPRLPATHPVAIAKLEAPDLEERVRHAMASIQRLRELSPEYADKDTAETLALADGTLAKTIRHFNEVRRHADADERAAMARSALGAVLDVGRMADNARHDAVARMGSRIDDEARYIAMRAGDGDLGALDVRTENGA